MTIQKICAVSFLGQWHPVHVKNNIITSLSNQLTERWLIPSSRHTDECWCLLEYLVVPGQAVRTLSTSSGISTFKIQAVHVKTAQHPRRVVHNPCRRWEFHVCLSARTDINCQGLDHQEFLPAVVNLKCVKLTTALYCPQREIHLIIWKGNLEYSSNIEIIFVIYYPVWNNWTIAEFMLVLLMRRLKTTRTCSVPQVSQQIRSIHHGFTGHLKMKSGYCRQIKWAHLKLLFVLSFTLITRNVCYLSKSNIVFYLLCWFAVISVSLLVYSFVVAVHCWQIC